MRLKIVEPHFQLKRFIRHFWVFESEYGDLAGSSRVIVPNGYPKIILPYKNTLLATNNRFFQLHDQGRLQFVGSWDEPITITTGQQASGTIIIQLHPYGAYPFLPVGMRELTNYIFNFHELYGKTGLELEDRIAHTNKVEQKVTLLQDFLIDQLTRLNASQPLVDYVCGSILKSNGRISIKELEAETRYSRRYLSLLFDRHIGISPKTLASITRFQQFQKLWAEKPSPDFYQSSFYNYYYDQAHFIKEFKRFSGYTPQSYAETENEFGRLFYK
jgi:AraC-like DNA-binding protein